MEELVSISEPNNFSYRIATSLAAVITSVKYINAAFNSILQFNYEKLLHFAADIINRNAKKKSPEEKLLNMVFEDYAINGYKYAKSAKEWTDGCIGIVKSNLNHTHVCMLKSHFENLTEASGIENSQLI